jgi:hypothetical protein
MSISGEMKRERGQVSLLEMSRILKRTHDTVNSIHVFTAFEHVHS